MISPKPQIVFFGTSIFAAPFLQALINNDLKPVLVITQPDEPTGRKQFLAPSPVKVIAQSAHLLIKQPANRLELTEILKNFKPDIGVLVAYGKIIPQNILIQPAFGIINVHPSLLPKYRGPSPVQTAIINGDDVTGVTIIILDEKIDHGPILAHQTIEILPLDNNETLHQRLAVVGIELLLKTLPKYLAGEIKPQPQDDNLATLTKIIKRDDGQIDWSKSAEQIERQFRAFYPWPGCFTYWGSKRLKIANLGVLEGNFGLGLKPGAVFLGYKNTLAVKCGQGVAVINQLQLEGKKEVSAAEFWRGHKEILGAVLGA